MGSLSFEYVNLPKEHPFIFIICVRKLKFLLVSTAILVFNSLQQNMLIMHVFCLGTPDNIFMIYVVFILWYSLFVFSNFVLNVFLVAFYVIQP